VPNKLVGGYVNCPECKGRLWVSRDAAVEPSPAAPSASPRSAAPPAPRKKVARFIVAEPSDSTLPLAADGKLPELRLESDAAGSKSSEDAKSMNPLVLFGIVFLSVALSIAIVLLAQTQMNEPNAEEKDNARWRIEQEYFGAGEIDDRNPAPYQVLLRDAHRAHVRGDFQNEEKCYRKVLDMLHAERGTLEKGLTGSRSRDKQLEEAINVLLKKK
jgi:hypothetical protein